MVIDSKIDLIGSPLSELQQSSHEIAIYDLKRVHESAAVTRGAAESVALCVFFLAIRLLASAACDFVFDRRFMYGDGCDCSGCPET